MSPLEHSILFRCYLGRLDCSAYVKAVIFTLLKRQTKYHLHNLNLQRAQRRTLPESRMEAHVGSCKERVDVVHVDMGDAWKPCAERHGLSSDCGG